MKNEDASKIHREQLNDAIQKIENVRMDLIQASRVEAKACYGSKSTGIYDLCILK